MAALLVLKGCHTEMTDSQSAWTRGVKGDDIYCETFTVLSVLG